jgi:L-threonylcarbamoyladenylate synthase
MKVMRVSEVGYQAAAEEAARALANGSVVLYPTDTLYGLAADALNPEAVELLQQLKGRERRKPISIIVSDMAEIAAHAELNDMAHAMALRHFPGALTLVVTAREHVPKSLTLEGAVGVRIPNDPFALALARIFANPYTATSANLAGEKTKSFPMDIIVALGPAAELVSLVIDDGPREGGVPSTVVLCTKDVPLVLRDGALSRKELGIE